MYKSKLQELCHQHSWNLPEYTAVKEGPDHNPKFTATVTVNSVQFHTPSDHQCRSSKDAQNQAAKIAFDHFTAPNSILQHHSSSSSSNSSSPVAPPNPNPNATPSSTEISQLYKSRLQIYAQKKNLALPTYSYVADGPPHDRRFKSTVTIDDKTYEVAEFYSTVKEAEHAAAKVALESLPSVETHQEDETLYKSLLQELSQKEGLGVPTYETIKSGPPHIPKFLSNAGIQGETFHGQEARTKKQAEMSAAKAAYKALIERSTRKNLALKSQMTDVSQPNAMREMQPDLGANINIVIHEGKAEEEKGRSRQSPGDHIKGPRGFSFYKVKSSGTDESQPFARAKANILVQEKQVEEGKDINIDATGSKASNSETEACHRSKVYVYPADMNLYHQDATILPISDDKWVAMKVETN